MPVTGLLLALRREAKRKERRGRFMTISSILEPMPQPVILSLLLAFVTASCGAQNDEASRHAVAATSAGTVALAGRARGELSAEERRFYRDMGRAAWSYM